MKRETFLNQGLSPLKKIFKIEMVIKENMVIIALTASSFLHFWVKSSTRSVPEANCLIWSVTVWGKADGISNFYKILLNLYKRSKQIPDSTEEISLILLCNTIGFHPLTQKLELHTNKNSTNWKYYWRGFIWMVISQDFVHRLKSLNYKLNK